MAENSRKRLTDGFRSLEGGVDQGSNPSILAPNRVANAVNLTMRGGFPRTRPKCMEIEMRWPDGEQKFWFDSHNIQGACVYRPNIGEPVIVVSSGGRIFRIDPSKRFGTNVVELTPSGDANPSVLPVAWMVQAEQYLIIQDGQSVPLIYDGSVMRRSSMDAPTFEVPVGTAMEYGLGRLIVVRPNRREYVVGDIVGGGTEVIQFTENDYLSEGGSIGVPIPGNITCVKILSQLDRSVGQGDLVVFTEYGACTARIAENRDNWKNIQFQSVALLGKGAVNQQGACLVNGDIFYRAQDGIRSLAMSRREFVQSWSTTPVSGEIDETLAHDTAYLLGHTCSVLFDNRLLMTCSQAPLTNGAYHRALAVLDFDLVSSMAQKSPPAYDGIWTGFKITALIAGEFSIGERAFLFHRNTDSDGNIENQLWEIDKSFGDDNDTSRIRWILETRSFDYQTPMSLKHLDGGDIFIDELRGTVDFDIDYRPDQYPCWQDWHILSECAKVKGCADGCVQIQPYRLQYRTKLKLPQPPQGDNTVDNRDMRQGYEHQCRISGRGCVRIKTFRVHASERSEPTVGCST